MMDFDEIKQILEMMREHELSEFELERDNFKLRIQKHGSGHWVATPHAGHAAHAPVAAAPPAAAPAVAGTPVLTAADEEVELAVVKSPIVGTFYRSAEPGARAYAEVGDIVKKGQVLCIIEAMKLMNEIESDCDGEIAAIYVDNGKPVQFGDRLFAVTVK